MKHGLRLASLLWVGGCSFAPPYHVPDSAGAPAGYQAAGDWQRTEPSPTVERDAWWTLFGDDRLNDLESRAMQANQSLQAAFARLEEARADTRVARADLFPTLTASGSAARSRVSKNSPTYLASTQSGKLEGNDFVLEGDLSYEIDLWGRVRNQVKEARATQQAQADALSALRLWIGAELANDYFALRTYDTQTDVLRKSVDDYSHSLSLVGALFDGGAVPLTDLEQAVSQLRSAQTQLTDAELLRGQMQHAIAVLIGEHPSAFTLPANPLPLNQEPPVVDPGLPSTLLQRRPDVAEAERRVAASNAQIGVARAAYFPQFSLIGSAGFNSVKASSFISAPSFFWSIGPQLSAPLFEGGRLVAQVEHAKATYREQVADYRGAVLTAFQDVEDNLLALRLLEREGVTQQGSVESAGIALEKSQERYEEGLVTYLEVSTNETTALQAQLSLVNVQKRRMAASVLLIKALGGGWDAGSAGQAASAVTRP